MRRKVVEGCRVGREVVGRDAVRGKWKRKGRKGCCESER